MKNKLMVFFVVLGIVLSFFSNHGEGKKDIKLYGRIKESVGKTLSRP